MPGSSTAPGRSDLAMVRPKRVAFRARNSVGTRGFAFAAQWLAPMPSPTDASSPSLRTPAHGAGSFVVVELHRILLAGPPAHFESSHPSQPVQLAKNMRNMPESWPRPRFKEKPRLPTRAGLELDRVKPLKSPVSPWAPTRNVAFGSAPEM